MTAPWLRQCFHSLSRRCSVSVQGSRSCPGAWGCCPSLQPSAPAAAAPALGLAAEQKPLECPMWRIPSPSTFRSGPRGSAGAVQAGWWHRSRALEKVAPAGTAPGTCEGVLLCRCCNAAGNARAKPSWRAGEGLLQPHPLQALLIKELIWTALLCASFVFRAATAGGDSSSVWCRQAGDSGLALGEGVWQQRLCSVQGLCSRSGFTVCRDSREGRKPQTTTSRETNGSGRCQGRQCWEPGLACHSHGGLRRLIPVRFCALELLSWRPAGQKGNGPKLCQAQPGPSRPGASDRSQSWAV